MSTQRQEIILPPEVLSKLFRTCNNNVDIIRNLMRTSKLLCVQVENALIYMMKTNMIKCANGAVFEARSAQTASKDMELTRLIEWMFSWYLYQWVLIDDEAEFNSYYEEHKYFLDYFLTHIMKWKSGQENINPRVRLALTSFQKDTARGMNNALVVTSVDSNVKQEMGVPKRSKVFAKAGIRRVENEFLLQVMRIRVLEEKESLGSMERSVRVLRVYQMVGLSKDRKVPVKRYCIEHGGMGGHWGDDQGQLLDIANSLSLNKYLNTHPDYDWLPPFIMASSEIISECIHDIDCNIDDDRISDPKKYKDTFLKKFAGLVVATKNKL